MTTKQTIEIDGLPEGWSAVAYRHPLKGDAFLLENEIVEAYDNIKYSYLIVEKIQPRRIVLEETDEDTNQIQQYFEPGFSTTLKKKWREVKEADIPLTNEEPKLSLTKGDMIALIEHIKLGGQLNQKIVEFIKDKSLTNEEHKLKENVVKVAMKDFSYEFPFDNFADAYAAFNSSLVGMNELNK